MGARVGRRETGSEGHVYMLCPGQVHDHLQFPHWMEPHDLSGTGSLSSLPPMPRTHPGREGSLGPPGVGKGWPARVRVRSFLKVIGHNGARLEAMPAPLPSTTWCYLWWPETEQGSKLVTRVAMGFRL